MTNGNQITREEQAQLAEYQVCQTEAAGAVSWSWQSGLIFFVTTLALAGAIISGLVNADFTWYRLVLIIGLGVLSILLLHAWKRYLFRQNFVRLVMFYRMGKIENNFGLRKNLYMHFLDDKIENDLLNNDERATLRQRFWTHPGRKPQGLKWTMRVVNTVMIAWIVFMILEAVIFFCYIWPLTVH
jgi:hypothetical protein